MEWKDVSVKKCNDIGKGRWARRRVDWVGFMATLIEYREELVLLRDGGDTDERE